MVTIQSQVDISIVQMKKWSFEKTKSSVQGHMGRKWQNRNIQIHMRLAPMQKEPFPQIHVSVESVGPLV